MKGTWIIMALLATYGFASAQQDDSTHVERQINIEKEYTPEIKDVKRKDIEYNIEEFAVRPSNLTYSNYALPINPQTPFSPLEAEKQNVVKLKAAKTGYADIGLGFNMNWRAEGYYKILKSESNILDVHLNHIGVYYGKKDPKAFIHTGVSFDYKHLAYTGHQIDANVSYRNRYYSYYGEDQLGWDTLKKLDYQQFQSRHTLNMSASAHSTKSMNDWDYKADLGYKMDDLQYDDLAELNLFGGVTGYKSFGKHQVELKLFCDGYIYSSVGDVMKHSNNVFVELAPYYNLNTSFIDLRVGARMLMACMRGQVFNAMPDVTATIHPHKMVRLTLAAVGDYRRNTVATMMDMNPYYIFNDTLKNSYTPADFRLALTVTPVSELTLSARANYAFNKNEVNFFNAFHSDFNGLYETRYFNALYIDVKHLLVGFTARYTFKERYSFMADFAWNKWFTAEDEEIWNKPECELHVGVEMMPIDGLRFDVNYYLATGRKYSKINDINQENIDGRLTLKDCTGKMNDIHDLNIGGSYLIKNLVTVYVRANNILGSIKDIRWQRWNGYDNMGFNMTFGAKIAF
ncbi:MAG: hypothetical protein MJ002_08155 [Paludibacteraceae bacterium]|nr:hypothetical protein [Paludibacteraceae bacterium]